MLFLILFYTTAIIIFVFLQNFFVMLTPFAIFFPIVSIFALAQTLPEKRYLILIGILGFFFDMIFTDSFGFYFPLFVLIAFCFRFLTQKILNLDTKSFWGMLIIVFLGVFFLSLLFYSITSDVFSFKKDLVSLLLTSFFSVFLFFLFRQILVFVQDKSIAFSKTNTKKHL